MRLTVTTTHNENVGKMNISKPKRTKRKGQGRRGCPKNRKPGEDLTSLCEQARCTVVADGQRLEFGEFEEAFVEAATLAHASPGREVRLTQPEPGWPVLVLRIEPDGGLKVRRE